MSHYKVIARKYRPQNFADVVGHDLTKQIIQNAIKSQKLSQALILTGIRGIGKTTLARIIAKSLACTERVDAAEACNQCNSCKLFDEGRHNDILEMDAASNTGVDDVRSIIDSVGYRPVHGAKKVYVIDEVHMLSRNAFNALLKTLEEPPEHVCFVFATTEIHKVPDTVLSRCLRINLQPFPLKAIATHLKNVCVQEDIHITDEALDVLARAGQGSMRDAMSLLEQMRPLSFDGTTIEASHVRDMLGVLDPSTVADLFESLQHQNRHNALTTANELLRQGVSGENIITLLLELTHTHIMQQAQASEPVANLPSEVVLQRYWSILVKALQELKTTPFERESLNVALLRLMFAGDISHQPTASTAGGEKKNQLTIPETCESFPQLLDILRQQNKLVLASNLKHYARVETFQHGAMDVHFSDKAPKDMKRQLEAALKELFNDAWQIKVLETSAAHSIKEEQDLKQKQLLESAKKHPLVKKILEAFPGSSVTIQ